MATPKNDLRIIGLLLCERMSNTLIVYGEIILELSGGLLIQRERGERRGYRFLGWDQLGKYEFMTRSNAVKLNNEIANAYEIKRIEGNKRMDEQKQRMAEQAAQTSLK